MSEMIMKASLALYYLVVVALARTNSLYRESSCLENQVCLPLSQCDDEVVYKLVQSVQASLEVEKYKSMIDSPPSPILTSWARFQARHHLRNISCGFRGKEAKVCCSQADLVVVEGDLEEWEFKKIIDQPVKERDEEKYEETAVCGRGSPFSLRISGGEETAPGDFPWMALLKYSDPVW